MSNESKFWKEENKMEKMKDIFFNSAEGFKSRKPGKFTIGTGFIPFRSKKEDEYQEEIQLKNILIEKNQEEMRKITNFSMISKRNDKLIIDNILAEKEKILKSLENMKIQEEALKIQIHTMKTTLELEIYKLDTENKKILFENRNSKQTVKLIQSECDGYYKQNLQLKKLNEDQLKEKEELEKKRKEEKRCCICLENPSIFACIPCGHRKFCEGCIQNINNCSLCQRHINDKVKIYD